MILEHPSRATQEKGDDHDADESAGWRMRDKPCEKLEHDNDNDHRDYREPTAAKNEKCEHARNGSDDDAEDNSDCRHQRRVLKILLSSKIIGEDTCFAGPVIEELLNPSEYAAEQIDDRVSDRSVACMLHAFIGVVVE
jgi:hypothetical protein